MQTLLKHLRNGATLGSSDAKAAFDSLLNGDCTPAQIGAFLMALSQRGETVDEIVAAAQCLRDRATVISSPPTAMDCCGTGGDHSGSYNISTAVAIILAACGVPVAKHGNRAASSQSGAADVLEALGVSLDVTAEQSEAALRNIGFCFLMAPRFHASLKPLAALRKELGFRTVFNLIGPLANPAGTKRQLIGVFAKEWVRPMAEALHRLGTERATVVHGADGLDEITLTGETYVALLHEDGRIEEVTLTPADFGLPVITAESIRGGDAATNAAALADLLDGKPSSYRDIVLANAAAALKTAGLCADYREGVSLAARAVDEGKARAVLQSYKDFVSGKAH